MSPRTLALASLMGWALLTVRHDSSCSGANLDWVLLEPVAHLFGVHALFREGAPLHALVFLAPCLGLALGAVTITRARRETGPWARSLVLGLGLGLIFASSWASLQLL